MKSTLFLLCGILINSSIFAQDTLSLNEAVSIALKKNYQILISQYDVERVSNQANPGTAGLMPTLDANVGVNAGINNSSIEFADGRIQEVKGAKSLTETAGVTTGYSLQGLGQFYALKDLKTKLQLAEANNRVRIESTIIQVCNAFYQMAMLQEILESNRQALQISRERVKRLEVRQEYGAALSTDILNARVDLNTDSVKVLTNIRDFQNARNALNYLLAEPISKQYAVNTNLVFAEQMQLEQLLEQTMNQNAQIIAARINERSAELTHKVTQSGYYPIIKVNAGYLVNKSQSEFGFALSNITDGINAGATVSWRLYNGSLNRYNTQNAKINIESKKLELEEQKLGMEQALQDAWNIYQNAKFVLLTEIDNLSTAEANFNRMSELYKLGQINTTQFREAQLNLLRSQNSISTARFTAKLAEIDIFRISGSLLTEVE